MRTVAPPAVEHLAPLWLTCGRVGVLELFDEADSGYLGAVVSRKSDAVPTHMSPFWSYVGSCACAFSFAGGL